MPENTFPSRNTEIRFLAILFIILSFFLITSYVIGSRVERGDHSVPTELASKSFPEVILEARSVYVYDVTEEKVLYIKNDKMRMPLASITKLMTALVASEIAPGYGMVVITADALEAEGDSGLKNGEKWSLKNLLDFSLITSSNDGMRAVALAFGALNRSDISKEEILNSFVSEMNRKAIELELKDTYFYNETGLDESDIMGGAYGTSHDVAMLFNYIISTHPDLVEATKVSSTTIMSLDENAHVARNTNILAGEIPGFLGSKTGYTNTAGGNLVFAFEPEEGRPVIVSILGSSEQGRFSDARTLIAAVEDYLREK